MPPPIRRMDGRLQDNTDAQQYTTDTYYFLACDMCIYLMYQISLKEVS